MNQSPLPASDLATPTTNRGQQPNSRGITRSGWLFRLAAIGLGLSVFVLAEAVCAVFDWGRPTNFDDPFVGFSTVHPLFVLDDSGQRYEIPPSRRRFFAKESFPARKPANEFRIFCLGGSTVQGRPFSIETSFTHWLELALQTAEPSRHWDVVNCGGISYASYRLTPILKECLAYEPDLFVICTGHNEFLEDRTYGHIRERPALLQTLQQTTAGLRSISLARDGWLKLTGRTAKVEHSKRVMLADDADALLDYRGGLAAYHRDEAWRKGVIKHFRNNLERMVAVARQAGVPVILVNPTSNLSDCRPFKSQHRDGMTVHELALCKTLAAQAQQAYRSDIPQAIEFLKEANQIDGQYAADFYELGKCYETLRQYDLAKEAFLRARELDICPLRILAPMEEAIEATAADTGVPFIDAQNLLAAKCQGGLLGNYLLVDHVHPSFRGHQMIAEAIADEMVQQGWVAPQSGWHERRTSAYDQHMSSLDSMYFLRGKRMLDSLRKWTVGEVDGPPLENKPSQHKQQPGTPHSPRSPQ